MHIVFKRHSVDKNGNNLYMGLVDNRPLGTLICHPNISPYSHYSYEVRGYLDGLKDLLKITGSIVTGTELTYEFDDGPYPINQTSRGPTR